MTDPRRKKNGSGKGRRGGKPRRPAMASEAEIEMDENSEVVKVVISGEDNVEQTSGETAADKENLMENYKRLAAEFDNYRKRQARDFNRLIEQGRKKLVTELLTVLDNFDRAREIAQGEHSDKEIVDGIMQTSEQMRSILRKEGLEEVKTETGDQFDPNIHEAMFAEDIDEGEFDIVLEIYEKAYRFGQDLLRPARVKVGRAPARDGG